MIGLVLAVAFLGDWMNVLTRIGPGIPQRAVGANDATIAAPLNSDVALKKAGETRPKAEGDAKAADDALHIAVAAMNGIPYLLTWNCRHLANATMRPVIENVCAGKGVRAPIICTPEELLEAKS